ncbi:unnamed protein product [Prorocentrum cordatum]|uniref:HMG box domain-containing protein n=1 Tax=Prorocentrum cordatum TaxID=2364126 RepID=A0ABN9X3L3_9DINO|nr:unnamed protein product [Polarella glacialis]
MLKGISKGFSQQLACIAPAAEAEFIHEDTLVCPSDRPIDLGGGAALGRTPPEVVVTAVPKGSPEALKAQPAPASPPPKRPASGYMLFANERRPGLLAARPELKGGGRDVLGEVAKALGTEWKELGEEARAPYERRAQELRAEYTEKKLEYLARHPEVRRAAPRRVAAGAPASRSRRTLTSRADTDDEDSGPDDASADAGGAVRRSSRLRETPLEALAAQTSASVMIQHPPPELGKRRRTGDLSQSSPGSRGEQHMSYREYLSHDREQDRVVDDAKRLLIQTQSFNGGPDEDLQLAIAMSISEVAVHSEEELFTSIGVDAPSSSATNHSGQQRQPPAAAAPTQGGPSPAQAEPREEAESDLEAARRLPVVPLEEPAAPAPAPSSAAAPEAPAARAAPAPPQPARAFFETPRPYRPAAASSSVVRAATLEACRACVPVPRAETEGAASAGRLVPGVAKQAALEASKGAMQDGQAREELDREVGAGKAAAVTEPDQQHQAIQQPAATTGTGHEEAKCSGKLRRIRTRLGGTVQSPNSEAARPFGVPGSGTIAASNTERSRAGGAAIQVDTLGKEKRLGTWADRKFKRPIKANRDYRKDEFQVPKRLKAKGKASDAKGPKGNW